MNPYVAAADLLLLSLYAALLTSFWWTERQYDKRDRILHPPKQAGLGCIVADRPSLMAIEEAATLNRTNALIAAVNQIGVDTRK